MSETITLVTPGPLARTAQAITARLHLAFPPGKFQHALVPAKLNEKTPPSGNTSKAASASATARGPSPAAA